jgi:hypothetical protein
MQREWRRIRKEKKQPKREATAASASRPQGQVVQVATDEEVDDEPAEYGDEPELVGEAEEDFENNLIDYYRHKMSSLSLIPPPLSVTKSSTRSSSFDLEDEYRSGLQAYQLGEIEGQIHPAFRSSIVFQAETGTFERASRVQHRRAKLRDSQSNYSRDSDFRFVTDSRAEPFSEELMNKAEDQAMTYMALLGLEDDRSIKTDDAYV